MGHGGRSSDRRSSPLSVPHVDTARGAGGCPQKQEAKLLDGRRRVRGREADCGAAGVYGKGKGERADGVRPGDREKHGRTRGVSQEAFGPGAEPHGEGEEGEGPRAQEPEGAEPAVDDHRPGQRQYAYEEAFEAA